LRINNVVNQINLVDDTFTLKFNKKLDSSTSYQLKYFGFNRLDKNTNIPIFKALIKNVKFVETLNFLKKKKITIFLCDNSQKYLKKIKTNEISQKKNSDYLVSIKEKPNLNEYNDFVSSINYLKRDLQEHQKKSLFHLQKAVSAAIFSVPGSGKTSVVLAYYEKLRIEKKVNGIFVIGPRSCFGPWEDEFLLNINRNHNSKILNINPTKRKIIYDQKLKNELFLVHFKTIANDIEYLKNFFLENKLLLVVDEAHNIKKIDGVWSNAVIELSKKSIYKVILTGTPLPNDLRDIYNYLDFLYGYNSIFSKKDRASIEILLNNEKKDEAINFVKQKIHPYYTRVTKKELNLSKPIFNKPKLIKMNPIEKNIYEAILTKIRNYGRSTFLNNIDLIQRICKARIIRLKQAASYVRNLDSALHDEDINIHENLLDDKSIRNQIKKYDQLEKPAKLIKLISMVKNLKNQNKKVLVWSTHLKTINLILKALLAEGIVAEKIVGKTDLDKRRNIKEEFNLKGSSLDVIVALPQACSESISLHKACHNAIYYDLNYNAAEFLQSLDRIHRVGGSEMIPVEYDFLHYVDTVDVKVYEKVFKKADRQMQIIEEENLTFDLEDIEENWETLYNDLSL